MSQLILVRHGATNLNATGRFAGLLDVPLIEAGRQQARQSAAHLRDIHFDIAYVSMLQRTQQTLDEIMAVLNLATLPTVAAAALNERDCGQYNGTLKTDVEARLDAAELQRLEYDWQYAPPGGETIAAVRDRVIPFLRTIVLPQLQQGRHVLVVASYNPIKVLKWHLNKLPKQAMGDLRIGNGEINIFTFDKQGQVTNRRVVNGYMSGE